MVEKNNYVAFIPVRGGSKSIPLKNIKELNGRPLVYWTIDAAVNCPHIDHVYISTDSELIREKVSAYGDTTGKLQCIGRSPETACDTASTESAMLEFAEKYDFSHIILIQATSPLLSDEDLTKAIEQYEAKECDSLLSAVRQKRFIWDDTDNGAIPVNYDFKNRPRRQEFDGFFVENGAFYITTKQGLLDSQCRLSGRISLYEMDETTYYEIDEPSDWVIIEHLLARRETENKMMKRPDIRVFLTDCDGVLTDGGMYYSEKGDELKKFNTKDGKGIELMRRAGIKVGIITGEDTQIVVNRANKLKLDYLYKGVNDKLSVMKEIATQEEVTLENIAYMGDDLNDIDCLIAAGLGITVSDATDAAKEAADIVVSRRGGDAAVREAAEMILR